jgi:predicted enzyme related to lactoylglutathione lyase
MRPVHFELPADDPARCITFYNKAFGWTFEKWDGPMEYWMIKTGGAPSGSDTGAEAPGIDGGLMKRDHPGQTPTNVIAVGDCDAATKQILAAGATQTVPKMGVPGVGWCAYFLDTENNPFGIIQFDPGATA